MLELEQLNVPDSNNFYIICSICQILSVIPNSNGNLVGVQYFVTIKLVWETFIALSPYMSYNSFINYNEIASYSYL